MEEIDRSDPTTMSDDCSVCVVCGESIPRARRARGAKYCSLECRREAYKVKYREANSESRFQEEVVLTPNERAAMCELLVAADLMRHGFQVFRALSPGAACNLVAMKAGQVHKVRVKAALRSPTGKLMFPKTTDDEPDIFALVERSGVIYYEPSLDCLDVQ